MPIIPRTWRIDFELDIMRDYLNYIHAYFEGERRELIEQIEKMSQGLSGEEQHTLYESFEDELSPLSEDFPSLFHTGFVISWYSFIETSLLGVCTEFNLKLEISAQDRPISDSGIFRARKFLKDAAKYEINNSHWQELLYINFIRNKIVHDEGKIIAYTSKDIDENRNYEILEIIKDNPFFLDMEHNQFLFIQKFSLLAYKRGFITLAPSFGFCTYLVDYSYIMLHKIYDDLEKLGI
jgi:hypothetical protein